MYIFEENKLHNGNRGYCTCAKCGNNFARVNLNGGRVIAVYPPINEYDYTCPECGYHGCVDEDSIFYLSDKAYKKLAGKSPDDGKKSNKYETNPLITAIKKDEEPVKENDFLLTMGIRNLKNIVEGYLDEIDDLYYKALELRLNKEAEDSDNKLKDIDSKIVNLKTKLISLISENVFTSFSVKPKDSPTCSTYPKLKAGRGLEVNSGAIDVTLDPVLLKNALKSLEEDNDKVDKKGNAVKKAD